MPSVPAEELLVPRPPIAGMAERVLIRGPLPRNNPMTERAIVSRSASPQPTDATEAHHSGSSHILTSKEKP
jgi:hypothetical protein